MRVDPQTCGTTLMWDGLEKSNCKFYDEAALSKFRVILLQKEHE